MSVVQCSLRAIDSSTQVYHQRVVQDVSFDLTVELNNCPDAPEFKLTVQLANLVAKFTEAQLLLLFGIIEDNLCEEPEICPRTDVPTSADPLSIRRSGA